MSSPRPRRSTYDRALDLLAVRARGEIELQRLLLRKGEPEADVNAAIDRLRESGLLNDTSFARQLTRSKALGAGASRRRIAQELARRGVDHETAARAITDVFDEEEIDEADAVERIARKKLRLLAGLDVATQRRRLYGHLARRGYDLDAIHRALRSVLSTEEQDADS